MADVRKVADWLRLLHEPGEVVELRIMNTERERTVVGFYDDMEALAGDAAKYDGKAPAIYATLNPVRPDLLARCSNRCKGWGHVSPTTDADIVRRRWLLIDCDPVRATGISSTEAEFMGAIARAGEVRDFLGQQGWPDPVQCLSGNGAHLLYRIDQPNDADSTALVKGCLGALAFRFDDGAVCIDTSVHNAARITKLYGTLACKGDDMPDRPHRRSDVAAAPSDLSVVSTELLLSLAASLPKQPEPAAAGEAFDIEDWIAAHGVRVKYQAPYSGGRKWILSECPWNAEHADSAIIEGSRGGLQFCCFHNSCQARQWADFRQLYEPGCYDGKAVDAPGPKPIAPVADSRPAAPSYERKKWSALDTIEYPPMRRIVGDILTPGLTPLAARPKEGKSQTVLNWSVAVALNGKASGRWDVDGGDVLYLALEDSWRRVQYRLRKKLAGRTVDPALMDRLEIQLAAPEVNNGLVEQLTEWCEAHPDRRMIVLDIWQRVRGRSRAGANPYSEDEALARPVQQLALRYDIAIVPIVHTRKSAADNGNASEEITGTNGFIGVADTLMVMRKEGGQMVLHVEGRDVDRQAIAMQWDTATESYMVADEPPASRVTRPWMTTEQLQVVEALDTALDWRMNHAAIEAATGKSYDNVRQIVRRVLAHDDSPLVKLKEKDSEGHLLFALRERIPARQQSWQEAIGPEVSPAEQPISDSRSPAQEAPEYSKYPDQASDCAGSCLGPGAWKFGPDWLCWDCVLGDQPDGEGLTVDGAIAEALEIVNAGVSI